jgi:hypothetical protein
LGDFAAASLMGGHSIDISAPVDAALTTYDYTVVIAGSGAGYCAVGASSGERALGICQGKVAAGGVARVAVLGVAFCTLGTTLSKGASVMSGGNGKVIASTTAGQELGYLLDGGVDGDIKAIVITHGGIY